jgi:hypothetical protein
MPVTRHHDHEVVGIADNLVVSHAVSPALGPLILGRHLLPPLLVEVIVQR